MAVPRVMASNHVFEGATLTVYSEALGLPKEALQDQIRSYRWRTATGWTITDHNNKIDFFRTGPGNLTATVANGHYATASSLSAAIVSALEAADATPIWECDYNVAATDKFRIRDNTGGGALFFNLLWSSGANSYRSIGRSLGYVVTADDTGGTGYTADQVNYQSQHFAIIALTAAQQADGTTACSVIGHNFEGLRVGNELRLESNSTNAWSSPTSQALLSGSTDQRAYFSDPNHGFYRLKVDDGSNPIGYFELGVLWIGKYTALPYCFSDNQDRSPEDLSTVNLAIAGTQHATFRSKQERRVLELSEIPEASASSVRALLEDIYSGQNIILDLDPPSGEFLYGFLPEPHTEPHVPTTYWNFGFRFWEAL